MACNTKFDMNHLTSWLHHIPVVRWSYFAYRWFFHIMMGILLWIQYRFKVFRNMQCHTLRTCKNSTLAQPRVIHSKRPWSSNLLRPRALCNLSAHFTPVQIILVFHTFLKIKGSNEKYSYEWICLLMPEVFKYSTHFSTPHSLWSFWNMFIPVLHFCC